MIEADRLVAAASTIVEEVADRAIRPKLLDEYIGQPQVRSQMEIFIQAAKLRGDALDQGRVRAHLGAVRRLPGGDRSR